MRRQQRRTWVDLDVGTETEVVMEPLLRAEDAIDGKLDALEALTGPGIPGAFRPEMSELNAAIRRVSRHMDAVKDGVEELRTLRSDLGTTLRDALLDTAARFTKARKPLPDWCADAAHVLTGGQSSYLHHPDDGRHQHDTDSGGNCRHPACRYSTYYPEPF